MTDEGKPASRPWLRFLRFSVRSLIVLVLVVGLWLGWLVRGARIQRDAVAAITKAGDAPVQGGKPWAAGWFVEMLGVDYFGNVAAVIIPSASDGELLQIRVPFGHAQSKDQPGKNR